MGLRSRGISNEPNAARNDRHPPLINRAPEAANFSASGLKRQNNDVVVIESAEASNGPPLPLVSPWQNVIELLPKLSWIADQAFNDAHT
jgi:hypothetical protein